MRRALAGAGAAGIGRQRRAGDPQTGKASHPHRRSRGGGSVHSGGSARLNRLEGRSRIQVNRLDDAVATQNMKKPTV